MSMQLQVEYRPVQELLAQSRNPRRHPAKQIDQLVESIRQFGWTAPIIIDGERGVLAGHGRLLAAKKLGMSQVPVIEIADLSPVEKRAYLIADNQLAIEATWDYELLRGELSALKLAEFDVEIVGFADAEQFLQPPPPEKPTKRGFGATSLQYNLIFEDDEQQTEWFGFIRSLKNKYPTAETLGQRLMLFFAQEGYLG